MSAVHVPVRTRTDAGAMSLAVLRIATGLLFLWAFFDKAFGLGYATPAQSRNADWNGPTLTWPRKPLVGEPPENQAFLAGVA